MPTLQRLEIWSDFQFAGGTRQAVVPLDSCIRLETTERIERDDAGTIEISKDAPSASSFTLGAAVRFLYSDASFSEWRIGALEDASTAARILRVTLQSPLMDLNTGAAPISKTESTVASLTVEYKAMTPSTVLGLILAFCPSGWSAGTVTPTIPVNMTTDAWLPLRALRALVEAINAQGVACELDYRRNGTSGYYIDLVTAIGSSAATLDVRTAKNLLSTTRRRERQRYATEVVPVGAGSPKAHIGRAWWECTAKVGTTLTMQQPVTGGSMLAFDDQLNTSRYLIDDTGAKQQITDCTAGATQQIVVASAGNVTAGRWYRVAADSSGNELVSLRQAAGTAGPIYVLESNDLTDVTNFINNAAMRDWSGAAPDDWTKAASGNSTYTKTTTAGLWVYGGQSCLVQNASLTALGSLASPLSGCYIPTTWTGYVAFSVWFRVKRYGDASAITFNGKYGNTGSTSVGMGTVNASTHAIDTWHRLDKLVAITSSYTGFQKFGVELTFSTFDTSSNEAQVYFDSAQVAIVSTNSAPDFTEGSDPARLWALGNNWLTTYSSAPTSYACSFADLGQWDPTGFPYETVTLGGTANVRDTDLGITTSGRVRELSRNWKNPLSSSVTIANRPSDLITMLSGIA